MLKTLYLACAIFIGISTASHAGELSLVERTDFWIKQCKSREKAENIECVKLVKNWMATIAHAPKNMRTRDKSHAHLFLDNFSKDVDKLLRRLSSDEIEVNATLNMIMDYIHDDIYLVATRAHMGCLHENKGVDIQDLISVWVSYIAKNRAEASQHWALTLPAAITEAYPCK